MLEIDAAGNNSVDDVRDLREKAGLATMRGGKKIYILDEAHMMSWAAFNALLKTLEEPPRHVIFILATTEPEKIIPAILSRCQHYRFRRLTPEEIAGRLASIVRREGMNADLLSFTQLPSARQYQQLSSFWGNAVQEGKFQSFYPAHCRPHFRKSTLPV